MDDSCACEGGEFAMKGFLSGCLALASAAVSFGQQSERPGGSLDNPIDAPRDLSGLSIKYPRVKLVHTNEADTPGGSLWLQQRDPWLVWQMGRGLFQREFREAEGVFGEAGKLDGPRLPDGATKIASRSHVNSCATCHSNPYRDAGAGTTIPKNGGTGRNTPHLFGAGLVEMLGQQMRLQILAQADDNRDGWISLTEAAGRSCRMVPDPLQVGQTLDFGAFDDRNGDGRPDLNEAVHPVFVDAGGRRLATAGKLTDPDVAGYNIEVLVFGFGNLYTPYRPPIPSTLRAFTASTFDIHQGMQPYDPTTLNDPDGDGFSAPSNAGCPQPLTQAGRDRGKVLTSHGISRDDPDRDGYCNEISEGELDLVEWHLLNHPRPGRGEITAAVTTGEAVFRRIGCAQCHVPDWQILPAAPDADDYARRFAGDRRFFDLDASWNPKSARMEAKLTFLTSDKSGERLPKRGGFPVAGIYTDFRYHDLGPEMAQLQFDGTIISKWRTTPLWGLADSAPYGHDGASLSLDDIIRRHGGEASASAASWKLLLGNERSSLRAFLQSLVLYQTDSIPADINGDRSISPHFQVADMDTGQERLNPEWLFQVPGKIEGAMQNAQNQTIMSNALTNLRQAYQLDTQLLRDRDHDCLPDAVDEEPDTAGMRDGVR